MSQRVYLVNKLCPHGASAVFLSVLVFCLAFLFSNARLNAQELGGLTGTVTDPTGPAFLARMSRLEGERPVLSHR